MKVALVHDWLNETSVVESVLEIFCEIFPRAPVYTLFYNPELIPYRLRTRKIIPSILQNFLFSRDYYKQMLPLYPWAVERFDFSDYDLIVSISHSAVKGVRVPRGAKHVCYCFSPMRFVWERFNIYYGKKSHLSPSYLAAKAFRKHLQKWDVKSSERVTHFIAASDYISEKIREHYGKESIIIPPPVDTEFFHPAISDDVKEEFEETIVGDFYMVLCDLVDYNHVNIAVETFRNREERLLIVGSGPMSKKILANCPENVTLLGNISNEELLWLYQNCRALILTSDDDFGISPLEVMSCGRPVIAFGRGTNLDIVKRGKTGEIFLYQTKEALTECLNSFNPDKYDPQKLREYALKFSRLNFFKTIKNFFNEEILPQILDKEIQN